MNEQHDRRTNDPLISEMHSMLATFIERLDNHIKEDQVFHKKLDEVDDRLHPVEEWHGSMKTAGKGLAIAGTPILLGVGAAFWVWIKGLLANVKVGQ